ncbi:MAG: hypothetical protein ACLGG9_03780 [Thermoleophilia bacterium]
MGRIADAALTVLARGPADLEDLAAELHAQGVTRARNPVAAVRRALRDDTRVIDLPDGRIASIAQALAGIELTVVVSADAAGDGRVEVEPDLAPLVVLGVGDTIELPAGVREGELVAVGVADPAEGVLNVRALHRAPRRPDDEAVLLDAVQAQLELPPPGPGWLMPPIAHLATVALAVAADRPELMQSPGRPLSEVLAGGGYECHLGWVGYAGTDWDLLTEDEALALEGEVRRLLMLERPAEAAAVQERLLGVLRRHMPRRVPPARRALARSLARAGRPDDALLALVSTGSDDPEDWYEAAVIACRIGDEVRARRWVESGLARVAGDAHADAALCLSDIGGDLDAQAGFLRSRAALGDIEPDAEGAEVLAGEVARIGRSYLLELLIEDVVGLFSPPEIAGLIDRLVECGDRGRDVCLALAAVAPEPLARRARSALGRDAIPRSRVAGGLLDAHAVAGWSTLFEDAPDQRQLIVTIEKEEGRVSALIVLIDFEDLGGAVKDAFFLPDMVEERLAREVIAPMEELGLRCRPISVGDAVSLITEGLEITRDIGWELPSLSSQPVLDRIERQLLHPRRIAG